MEIKKDSRIYKLAYGIFDDNVPTQTTLCKLFWRCILMTVVAWPFFVLLYAIFTTVIILRDLLIPMRPEEYSDFKVITFTDWPEITTKSGNKKRIYPIWIVLELTVVYYFAKLLLSQDANASYILSIITLATVIVILALTALVIAICIFIKLRDSQITQLFIAYLKAKKQKVCPIIVFR